MHHKLSIINYFLFSYFSNLSLSLIKSAGKKELTTAYSPPTWNSINLAIISFLVLCHVFSCAQQHLWKFTISFHWSYLNYKIMSISSLSGLAYHPQYSDPTWENRVYVRKIYSFTLFHSSHLCCKLYKFCKLH